MFSFGLFGIGSIFDLITLPNQVIEANIRQAILEEKVRRKIDKKGLFDSQPDHKQPWRNINDGESRIVNKKEPVERVILKLAKEHKGIITASELALSADIPIDEAKKNLDAMVSKGFAELRVRQSGALVYTILDFLDNNEPLVD